MSDFSNIQIFHPNVLDVDQLSQVDRGLGAERRCNFYGGGSAVEKIISWDDERQFFTCTVESAAPILDVTAGMRVNRIDSHHAEVELEMTYVPKWGIFGKVVDLLVLRMAVRSTFNKVLKGLKHHVETGELVGKGGKPIARVSQPNTTQLQQG